MSKLKTRLSIGDAMSLVDDNLPDGAYFAMLDELTGSEPGGAIDMIERGAPVLTNGDRVIKRTMYRVKYYDAKLSKKGQGVQCRTFTDRADAQKFADANRIYAGPCKVEEYRG